MKVISQPKSLLSKSKPVEKKPSLIKRIAKHCARALSVQHKPARKPSMRNRPVKQISYNQLPFDQRKRASTYRHKSKAKRQRVNILNQNQFLSPNDFIQFEQEIDLKHQLKCELCEVEVEESKEQLRDHALVHATGKRHMCSLCPFKSSSGQHMITHLRCGHEIKNTDLHIMKEIEQMFQKCFPISCDFWVESELNDTERQKWLTGGAD